MAMLFWPTVYSRNLILYDCTDIDHFDRLWVANTPTEFKVNRCTKPCTTVRSTRGFGVFEWLVCSPRHGQRRCSLAVPVRGDGIVANKPSNPSRTPALVGDVKRSDCGV